MWKRSDTGRAEIQHARPRFRQADQLRHGAGGHRRMHGKHLHGVPDPGDRHERSRVVPDVLVDQRSDEKIAGAAQQNRVAIGFSGDHRFRPNRAAGAGRLDYPRSTAWNRFILGY
jgi:hypothetical protein